MAECGRRDALELACPACHSHYCLTHRHAPDHSCPSLEGLKEQEQLRQTKFEAPTKEFKQAKEALDKQLNTQLRTAKNKERAAKVQLMRLKSRATLAKQGLNIAVSERVYFLVKAPEKVGGEAVLVTSSAWSLGRALDAAAEACGVKNTNNLPNSPQLRLFNDDKSPVASHEMHHTISYLTTQHLLHDGQTLLLEYI